MPNKMLNRLVLCLAASPLISLPLPAEAGAWALARGADQDRGGNEPPQDPAPPSESGDESKLQRPVTISDAEEMLNRGKYPECLAAFAELSENADLRERTLIGEATALARTGRYDETISRIELLGEPRPMQARLLHAEMARIHGRYDDALGELRGVVDDFPEQPAGRRRLGELLEYLGKRDDAIATYRWFDGLIAGGRELPRDAAWLTDAAVGFYRFSVLTQTNLAARTRHVLHEMLQQAYGRIDRNYWPARIAGGELLREKYSNSEEDGSLSDFLAALEINENLTEAHVGIGRVLLENWNFEKVEEQAEKALAVNPKYAPAIYLLASKFIVERRYDQAIETAGQALEINPHDIEALSITAAAAACKYDDALVAAMKKRVEEINPRCARFYQRLGDALGGIRQYGDSEKAYLKAIELEPTNPNSRAELGMMCMQWGDEDKARAALEGAWAIDEFNQRTKFTLDLLDSLAGFAVHESAHFLVKYDPKRDPGLGEAVGSYLEDIYEDLVDDYAFPLKEKTIIEMFPTQRAFAVRITGKPWIHTVGACTGKVIAMASPRNDPNLSGTYNFARVLKHEFTHTVTLAATRNRIPHWFTEGLAVYQEDAPRSFAWCTLLAEAARRDELFTLESIDWGFIRPRKPSDRQMAYAQSEWMCEYIVERFGYDKINDMLAQYRQGNPQADVMQAILQIDLERFSQDFVDWARKEIDLWGFDLTPPEDPEALRKLLADKDEDVRDAETIALEGRLAKALYEAGEFDEALEAARHTLKGDAENAHALEALIEVLSFYDAHEGPRGREERYQEMFPAAQSLLALDPGNWVAVRKIGEILLFRREYAQAEAPLRKLQQLCPFDPTSWRGLAAIYLDRGEQDAAFVQLMEVARLDENDADVRHRLGRISWSRERIGDARYWFQEALYADPFNVEFHADFADLLMQSGETARALDRYLFLTLLMPGDAEHFEKAAFAALKMGNRDEAKKLAVKAFELDPNSAAKSLID
ncbi:MAG: peptidase MA family metallohydrolase [Planctomycetota bacterium]|jgi:tetratricopeptide (TPR) repeat protein